MYQRDRSMPIFLCPMGSHRGQGGSIFFVRNLPVPPLRQPQAARPRPFFRPIGAADSSFRVGPAPRNFDAPDRLPCTRPPSITATLLGAFPQTRTEKWGRTRNGKVLVGRFPLFSGRFGLARGLLEQEAKHLLLVDSHLPNAERGVPGPSPRLFGTLVVSWGSLGGTMEC